MSEDRGDRGAKTKGGPLVGIAMATFNPKLAFFLGQISSLRKQTYSNWSCLIVDDCSSEESFQMIQDIIDGDPRFVIHRNESNLGSFKTFERALGLLPDRAELICYCDQDDIWISTKLEVQVQAFDDPEVYLVHSDQSLIDQKGRLLAVSCWDLEGRSVFEATTDILLFRNLITGCTTMFRSEVIKLALPFGQLRDQREMYHHDIWIAMHACLLGRVIGLKQPLVLYRQHGDNLVGVSSFKRNVKLGELVSKAKHAYKERLGLRQDFLSGLERGRRVDLERASISREQFEKQKIALGFIDSCLGLFFKGFGFVIDHPLFFRTWVMLGVGHLSIQRKKLFSRLSRSFGQ